MQGQDPLALEESVTMKAVASALGIAVLCVSSGAQPNDGETLYRRGREALVRGEAGPFAPAVAMTSRLPVTPGT